MNPKSKVTLEDIAARVGVSAPAVSQALSGKGRISPETRARILQVVEELAYQPDAYAQNLARRSASQAQGKRLPRSKSKLLPPPGILVFYNVPDLVEVLRLEFQQKDEEGCDVEKYRSLLDSLPKLSKQKLYHLYNEILSAPLRSGFTYEEPDILPEIQAARPSGPRQTQINLTRTTLFDQIYGAWLGRVAGCVLGKPIEAGWSKRKVEQYLTLARCLPLDDYIPRVIPTPAGYELADESAQHWLGEIHGAPPDDDTDYTILALHLLEVYGLEFKIADVATEWLGHLPYFRTYTTERAVYRNLIWNIHPEDAATFVNPEREFIGARIRADLFGWIAPGKPELAAALAYKDARLSHTRNGIYAAMFMAAMNAWAYVTHDLEEIVKTGLSEIPRNCRLAEAIRDVLATLQQVGDWEIAYEHLILKYGSYSPVHAINNTVWVALALLSSQGDFSRALCNAVTCGFDTDCNAANVGAVMGLIHGSQAIPEKWTAPLQDTLYTTVSQFPELRISDLARRTAKIAESVLTQS